MNICFITASMTGGGAERVIANLANEMTNRGHQLKIVMTAGSEVAYSLNPTIKVIQIGDRTGGAVKARIDRIVNLRKIFKADRKCAYIAMQTDTAIFALIAAIGLNINLIVSERNDPNIYENIPLREAVYHLADKIVFQTKQASECYSARLQKLGMIIPNPISPNLPEVYNGTRSKRIVAVGRLEPQKNHRLLIDAFSEFHKTHDEYSLHIYGKGGLEDELSKQINDLGLRTSVTLEGFSSNILEDIKDAAMYVLSSEYEGISNSLIEAMAIGLPVISTDCPIGGSSMMINNMENGILTEVGDSYGLSKAMMEIADDSALSKKLSTNAVKVRDDYSIQMITDMWMEYLLK